MCGSIATNMENYLQTLDPGTGTLTAIEGSISGATDVAAMTTVLNNLEKAERLIDQARDILYRTPTQIKVVVEECDEEEKITCSQDTR